MNLKSKVGATFLLVEWHDHPVGGEQIHWASILLGVSIN
jgi:hypothetical protein